jgi:hypothetical protein
MIEESASAFIPLWMLISAAFGFMIGDAFGDTLRHRKCLQQTNEDLRDELEKARAFEAPLCQALKQQRGVINDIHKRLSLFQKPSKNTPRNSNKINGRIAPIRPFIKV